MSQAAMIIKMMSSEGISPQLLCHLLCNENSDCPSICRNFTWIILYGGTLCCSCTFCQIFYRQGALFVLCQSMAAAFCDRFWSRLPELQRLYISALCHAIPSTMADESTVISLHPDESGKPVLVQQGRLTSCCMLRPLTSIATFALSCVAGSVDD